MAFNMYGYSRLTPILWPIRPRFFGWIGFMPGWMDYMEWMDESDYLVWHRFQETILDLRLSRMERRTRLLRMLRENSGGNSRQLEERADRMLGMEDDLGADEYGHVINRTETTTTTTTETTVTPQQRTEVIGLIIESAKASANPNTSLTQLRTVIENIRAGKSDDVVRAQLEKMKSGEVKQIQQTQPQPQLQPAPAQQQIEYGQIQQTTQNFQQNVQTSPPQQQPMYLPAPLSQQPGYAPEPQQQQPVQEQPTYAPTPEPMQPQLMPQQPMPQQSMPQQSMPQQFMPQQSMPQQPMQQQPMAPMPPTPAPKQKQPKFSMPPETPALVQQNPSIQYGAYAGQQAYTQSSSTTTTTTTTSSSSSSHAGQAHGNPSSYQSQTTAPSYSQQQIPQQSQQSLPYQQHFQITQGQATPPVVDLGQPGQMTQPQMAHAGQMGLYTPKSKKSKSKSKHSLPAGQPGGYSGTPTHPQQVGGPASQQQPQQLEQYGQPSNLQSFQQAPAGQQYLDYSQAQQPAYSQELLPSSSALKPHKGKNDKKRSSKKERR